MRWIYVMLFAALMAMGACGNKPADNAAEAPATETPAEPATETPAEPAASDEAAPAENTEAPAEEPPATDSGSEQQ